MSSSGSIQNAVEAAPHHQYSPTDPASCVLATSVVIAKPKPKPTPAWIASENIDIDISSRVQFGALVVGGASIAADRRR